MSKITLKEFWDSKEQLAIHCDTEEKANKLLIEFDKMGKKCWDSGRNYLEENNWECYEKNTCYDNMNLFCWLSRYKDDNFKIYEFEDVIFESESDKSFEFLIEFPKAISGEIRPLRTNTLYVNFDKKVVVLKTFKNETIKIQCDKDDKFDWKIGFALCLSKLSKDDFKYKKHREYFRKKGVLDIKKYTNWVLTEYYNNDLISMEQELKFMEKELLEKGKIIL